MIIKRRFRPIKVNCKKYGLMDENKVSISIRNKTRFSIHINMLCTIYLPKNLIFVKIFDDFF